MALTRGTRDVVATLITLLYASAVATYSSGRTAVGSAKLETRRAPAKAIACATSYAWATTDIITNDRFRRTTNSTSEAMISAEAAGKSSATLDRATTTDTGNLTHSPAAIGYRHIGSVSISYAKAAKISLPILDPGIALPNTYTVVPAIGAARGIVSFARFVPITIAGADSVSWDNVGVEMNPIRLFTWLGCRRWRTCCQGGCRLADQGRDPRRQRGICFNSRRRKVIRKFHVLNMSRTRAGFDGSPVDRAAKTFPVLTFKNYVLGTCKPAPILYGPLRMTGLCSINIDPEDEFVA